MRTAVCPDAVTVTITKNTTNNNNSNKFYVQLTALYYVDKGTWYMRYLSLKPTCNSKLINEHNDNAHMI
jgi:hypothetical protein